ncbi:response regulator transcription factor [Albibacillus kandeliae]|uniref:response regulator transcription factor n=1 Tax=Albibacillus kandeliae TaxID=2174228 RepID=UPI000D6960FF|nr:response regulator [Albibacillus kandeliae]
MHSSPLVHILDDDDSMRLALSSLLRSVGLSTSLHDSVATFLAAERPDVEGCLLLDIRLPGVSGLDLQGQLEERGIHLPVVLMTGHGDIPMTVRGMKAGAVDFLTKPFRDQDMLDAVAAALERDRARRAREEEVSGIGTRFETLSPREREVMALVTRGLLNKQVAGELGLSEVTVKIHRGAAMKKMGARTLPELVRMADALGLGAEASR